MKTEKIKSEKLKIYDNGGKTQDRYTVVFMERPEREARLFEALGMDSSPFHPQGFGQHCSAMTGGHLGQRILFEQLPPDCQKFVEQNL